MGIDFEPVSAVILQKLLGRNENQQKLLQEIVNDKRFVPLELGLIDGGKTTIAKGSKINTNKKNTLQLAKELNKRNIDVTFLPESNDTPSADAIIKYRGKLMVAELKFSNTTKENTLYTDLKDGFGKAPMVVLKLNNMDLGVFSRTIEQLKRKGYYIGNMLIVNNMGIERFISRKQLTSGNLKKKMQGLL